MTLGTRISDMTPKAALVAGDMVPIISGGQNYIYDLGADTGGEKVGAFATISTLTVSASTKFIRTLEYVAGSLVGGAFYIADPAVDAAFVAAHPGWSKLSANGVGFRLYEMQDLWFEMFGGKADVNKLTGTGTDNIPAWLIARDFIHYFRDWPSGNYYYKPSVPVHFRAKQYYFSDAIDLTDAAYVLLGGGNNAFGLGGSQFFIASGKCGMLLQSWDTQGTNGTHTNDNLQPYNHGASSSLISDITVYSLGGTFGNFQHGFVLKCQATFQRCFAQNFAGDGFHAAADVNTAGNANGWKLLDCGAVANGLAGLYLDGGDANAGYSIGFQAFRNGTWGIYDSSFLGNHHFFFQTDGNGVNSSGPSWLSPRPSTFTNRGGHVYRVRPGQDVAASTTTPGTNAGIWIDQGAGSTSLGGTWANGQAFCSGGAYYADDNNARCVFAGYQEGDQAAAWIDSTTSCVLPGFSSPQVGAFLAAAQSTMLSGKFGTTTGGVTSGHFIQTALGGNSSGFDNVFFQLGNNTDNATLGWSWHVDNSNNVYQRFLGADGSAAYTMLPPGSSVGMSFPRGAAYGNVAVYGGSAVPAAGTWTLGAYVYNDLTVTTKEKGWRCTAAGTPGTWETDFRELYGSTTVDLASIANTANSVAITITVTGAAVGDLVTAISTSDGSIPLGCFLSAQVTAANTVKAFILNNSGGAYDPPSATYRAEVRKQ